MSVVITHDGEVWGPNTRIYLEGIELKDIVAVEMPPSAVGDPVYIKLTLPVESMQLTVELPNETRRP